MTPTLSDLRRLLEGALTCDGPAIDRLSVRTVEALATAYLPRSIWRESKKGRTLIGTRRVVMGWYRTCILDLTDPGTAHALLVALALYHGLDPGVGALQCRWDRARGDWWLTDGGLTIRFCARTFSLSDATSYRHAPAVAAEPNPVRALALAVAHVLP